MNEVDFLILYFDNKVVEDLVVEDILYDHDEYILDIHVVFYMFLQEKIYLNSYSILYQ